MGTSQLQRHTHTPVRTATGNTKPMNYHVQLRAIHARGTAGWLQTLQAMHAHYVCASCCRGTAPGTTRHERRHPVSVGAALPIPAVALAAAPMSLNASEGQCCSLHIIPASTAGQQMRGKGMLTEPCHCREQQRSRALRHAQCTRTWARRSSEHSRRCATKLCARQQY